MVDLCSTQPSRVFWAHGARSTKNREAPYRTLHRVSNGRRGDIGWPAWSRRFSNDQGVCLKKFPDKFPVIFCHSKMAKEAIHMDDLILKKDLNYVCPVFFKLCQKKLPQKMRHPKRRCVFWTCRLLGLDSKGPFIYAFIWANGANVLAQHVPWNQFLQYLGWSGIYPLWN